MDAAQTRCQHCGQPFQIFDKHIAAWRASDGRLYCNEYCAETAEDTQERPFKHAS
jgi:hypothetical protein